MPFVLSTVKYRRHRGDMIEVFKIVSGKYDQEVSHGILKFNANTATRAQYKWAPKQTAKAETQIRREEVLFYIKSN